MHPTPISKAEEEAKEFLLQILADGRKPCEAFTDADKLRISRASLRRATADLGVISKKTPDHWEWSMPRAQPHRVRRQRRRARR